MTDTTAAAATATTDQAQSSPATTTSDATTTATPAAAAQSGSYLDSFKDESLRGHATLARYKEPEDLARAHVLLEKRLGVPAHRLLTVPDKAADQDPEGWKSLYTALGRPETVDGYGIKLPDTASDFDKSTFGEFAGKMHAAGATKAQMDVATAEFARAMQVTADKARAEQEAAVEAGKVAIEKHFGAKLPTYETEITGKLLHATDASGKPILSDEEIGQIDAAMKGNNLGLLKLLAHTVDLLAEPETLTGGTGQPVGLGRGLTPEQAKTARLQLDETERAVLDDNAHPRHEVVMNERRRLLRLESGQKPA